MYQHIYLALKSAILSKNYTVAIVKYIIYNHTSVLTR